MSTLFETFKNQKDYCSDKWLWYFDIYDLYFPKFVGKKATILEIGIQNCGFLQVMDRYFQNAKIFGIDIDEKVTKLTFPDSIKVLCFDGTNRQLLDKNLGDTKFDIIIDDASHTQIDVMNSFKNNFHRLNPGGIFL